MYFSPLTQVDFQTKGHIVDDVSRYAPLSLVKAQCGIPQLMHEIMVKSLPAGCRLTAIFDV
jgi:hypothetical protein